MKTRAAVSDFSPVKQRVLVWIPSVSVQSDESGVCDVKEWNQCCFLQEYPEDELLLVFDRDFTFGQSFYLVLTVEAKENILKVWRHPTQAHTPDWTCFSNGRIKIHSLYNQIVLYCVFVASSPGWRRGADKCWWRGWGCDHTKNTRASSLDLSGEWAGDRGRDGQTQTQSETIFKCAISILLFNKQTNRKYT